MWRLWAEFSCGVTILEFYLQTRGVILCVSLHILVYLVSVWSQEIIRKRYLPSKCVYISSGVNSLRKVWDWEMM